MLNQWLITLIHPFFKHGSQLDWLVNHSQDVQTKFHRLTRMNLILLGNTSLILKALSTNRAF